MKKKKKKKEKKKKRKKNEASNRDRGIEEQRSGMESDTPQAELQTEGCGLTSAAFTTTSTTFASDEGTALNSKARRRLKRAQLKVLRMITKETN